MHLSTDLHPLNCVSDAFLATDSVDLSKYIHIVRHLQSIARYLLCSWLGSMGMDLGAYSNILRSAVIFLN